jgi:N-acyl-D-amino-acid deacylase
MLPAARRVLNQPLEVQKKLYGDYEYRRQLESEVLKGGTANAFVRYDRQEISHVANPKLKRLEGKTLAQVAAMRGVAPSFDLLLDLALEDDLNASFMLPILNTDEARMARLVADPRTLIALSDGGAHVDQLCDSGYATYLLGHWVREKQALSLEYAVKRITSEPANLFGLRDRGRLSVGAAADIAIFDPQTVGSGLNRDFLFDFPIPTRSIARTAFLCKALADFVPQCSQVVAEVADGVEKRR